MAFIPAYILILFFVITIDYIAGITIANAQGQRRKLFLLLSLAGNIGVLAIFKYFNFLNANLAGLAGAIGWNYPIPMLDLILPIGLSFHTFQSMSYTIEVYRGRYPAEKHPGIFALYVMFYPQLVAGPIERPYNLLPQLHRAQHFDYQRVTDGLKLMAWGFFKKLVIADRIADFVNPIYNHPTEHHGFALILATALFAYQIYCDFSGYSDIAIGSAQVMGFKLMQNFNRPYYAKSIGEFWRRWHISLSSWFRDYLYIPLGGNRVPAWRHYFNVMTVFLISGLWHGANWTFVIWGGLHGAYLLIETWTESARAQFIRAIGLSKFPNALKLVQVTITFALVSLAWIFFRANSLNDAMYIAAHLITPDVLNLANVFTFLNMTKVALAAIIVLEIVQLVQRRGSLRAMIAAQPTWVRWAAYYLLVMSILLFGKFAEQKFIYFQF